MNILRYCTFIGLVIISLASCTIVTSTNVPGKKATKFPKSLIGKYELQYPEALSMLAGEVPTYVTFKADRMIIDNTEGQTTNMIGDSLFLSTIGKQVYISLGVEPNISVFKIVKSGKNLELFSMCSSEGVTLSDLENYFSKVEEIPGEVDDEGEVGESSYTVTIDDAKLDSYFKSKLPMSDPFKLIKQ
jgi:hypothetical protein